MMDYPEIDIVYPEKKSRDDKAMFDDIVQGILNSMRDDVVKIILYGSVARGDNTWDSDIDIAVLSVRNYNWQEEKKLDHVFAPIDIQYNTLISIVIIDEHEFDGCKHVSPFFKNIDTEGLILWTKKAA